MLRSCDNFVGDTVDTEGICTSVSPNGTTETWLHVVHSLQSEILLVETDSITALD